MHSQVDQLEMEVMHNLATVLRDWKNLLNLSLTGECAWGWGGLLSPSCFSRSWLSAGCLWNQQVEIVHGAGSLAGVCVLASVAASGRNGRPDTSL